MKNILKVYVFPVKPKSPTDFIIMQKEIDFTPSKGLILYKPICGTIGIVVYNGHGFTATMEDAITPTDESTMIFLKSEGWIETN